MTTPPKDTAIRILVVDDEPVNRELAAAMLTPSGYEVLLVDNGEAALQMVREEKPDLIILDLMMPGLSGFEVCARVKMDPETRETPVLIVTALNDIWDKKRAMAAGGDDFLTKPYNRGELLARVEALLKVRHLNLDLDRALAYLHALELAREAEKRRERVASAPPQGTAAVLLVDDELLTLEVYSDMLQDAGYVVHKAANGMEALEIAQREQIEVVLLDIMMPKMSGLEVLEKLGELIPDSPVVIVTAQPTSENAIAALRLGAFDFIMKGSKGEVMLSAVSRALERRRMVIRNQRMLQRLETKIQELEGILREYAEEGRFLLRRVPERRPSAGA